MCRRLPRPVSFKLLGGEPTMHPKFFEFITIGKSYGHSVFFATNGLRYTNPKFMKKLQALDVTFIAGLSMNGGTTNDDFYEVMNNRRILDKKMEGLTNLIEYGIKRVALSAIVVRGYNEQVIGELIELAEEYPNSVKYLHFRSAAMTGRWVNTEPYTAAELKQLMRPYFPKENNGTTSGLQSSGTTGRPTRVHFTKRAMGMFGLLLQRLLRFAERAGCMSGTGSTRGP